LAHDQAADNGEAERMTQLRADAAADHQRQRAEERCEGSHEDRPEAQQASLTYGVERSLSLETLRIQREVDHHDRVLLHDSYEKNDADHGDDAELLAANEQRGERPDR